MADHHSMNDANTVHVCIVCITRIVVSSGNLVCARCPYATVMHSLRASQLAKHLLPVLVTKEVMKEARVRSFNYPLIAKAVLRR